MKRRVFLILLPALLAGCGFQLRRLTGIPFSSLYLSAPAASVGAARLRKALVSGGYVRLAANAEQAEVVLTLSQEKTTKTILSLSGAGRVTEYRLGYRLTYSLTGKEDRVWIEPDTLELTRDLTYDDSALLAKSAEEQLLYRDMQDDAVQQILRRLRSLKLTPAKAPGLQSPPESP